MTDHAEEPADPVATLGVLSEPARRALYDYVVAQPAAVSRDDAADAVGLKRSTAAFHLDRLAEQGLLDVEFRRLSGRVGPGAGRPAKLYCRASHGIEVSLPPRRYALAGQVLARAVERAATTGADVRGAVHSVAREMGTELAAEDAGLAAEGAGLAADGAGLETALDRAGYEPRDEDGDVVLANCPFHDLARDHTELVCGMNLGMLQGLLEGLGDPRVAVLDPADGRCCVRIRTQPPTGSGGRDAG